MSTVRLYPAHPRGNKSKIRLLDPVQESAQKERDVLFKRLPSNFRFTGFSLAKDLEEADFVIIPQAIRHVDAAASSYLKEIRERSRGKPVIVFLTGDLCHREHIDLPGYVVFKGSEYGRNIRDNEIVFASFVEDLGEQTASLPRKKGEQPVIGFCGYAAFPSWKTRLKYVLQNVEADTLSLLLGSTHPQVYKRGIYFRRKAIAALEKDDRMETNFIIRSSFSGNAHTVEKDPQIVRREYIDNMVASDLVLAPKGDANFSARFYEALSLGRVPILIDTDMVLPLAHLIDYDEFCLRVPYTELPRLGDRIMQFWNETSPERFAFMQKRAKEVYASHLRFDSYFNHALPLLKEGGVQAVVGA